MGNEEQEKILESFLEDLINNQQDLPPEFQEILNDNFWDLIE